MKETSLKTQLHNLVKDKEYVSINGINDITEQLGYKISNGERRMRELVKNGLVKKIMENGVVVGYTPILLQKPEIKTVENVQAKLFEVTTNKLSHYDA